jgi:hypothetical protein
MDFLTSLGESVFKEQPPVEVKECETANSPDTNGLGLERNFSVQLDCDVGVYRPILVVMVAVSLGFLLGCACRAACAWAFLN